MTQFAVNRACPVTGQAHVRLLAQVPARVVAAENPTYRADFAEILGIAPDDSFPFVEGPSGLVYAGWLPPEDFLNRLYEDVIDHSRSVTQTLEYRRSLLEFGAALFQMVEQRGAGLGRPLRLLDYGCGYGAILPMVACREVEALGYEPSAARGQRAAAGQVPIVHALDDVEQAGPFDIIVCTEVLEHVPQPRALLAFLRRNARPGAILALTVPDCEPHFVKASFRRLEAEQHLPPVFNPWEHLNYFSAQNLRQLLLEEGFAVLNDYGQTIAARNASSRFGDCEGSALINGLRVAKRAMAAAPTTQLFCRRQ